MWIDTDQCDDIETGYLVLTLDLNTGCECYCFNEARYKQTSATRRDSAAGAERTITLANTLRARRASCGATNTAPSWSG